MRAVALLLFLAGCSTTPGPAVAPETEGATAPPPAEPSAREEESAADREPEAESAPAEAPLEEPNPVAVRINEKYEASSATTWEKRFERQGREVHDKRDAILKALAIGPGDRVADVGVGSGLFTLSFAKAVSPGGKVFGVDVQDYFLEHVETKADKAGIDNIVFVKAEQRSVNLDPESVDLVFMCDVFHHVEYPRTYLATLYAALAPGGRLVVIDFIAEKGKSEPWILRHVRASPGEFRAEFEGAGFVFEDAPALLDENFFHIYRKPK